MRVLLKRLQKLKTTIDQFNMSRYTSPYQFYDDLEMRDAGYEYKYPKTPAISWSEEDSQQWADMGEGRSPCDNLLFKLYPLLRQHHQRLEKAGRYE